MSFSQGGIKFYCDSMPSDGKVAIKACIRLIEKIEIRVKQIDYLQWCDENEFVPKSIRVKNILGFRDRKVEKAEKAVEKARIRASIGKKKGEISRFKVEVGVLVQGLRTKLQEDAEEVVQSLCLFKDWRRKKESEILTKRVGKGEVVGRGKEFVKVVVIGDVEISSEEKAFLELGRGFSLNDCRGVVGTVCDLEDSFESCGGRMREEEKDEIREEIKRVIGSNSMVESNLKKEERIGLGKLLKREDVQVMRADKGGAMVVMERELYKKELLLLKSSCYEEVSEEVVAKSLKQRNGWVNKLVKVGVWKESEGRRVKGRDWCMPEMMGFPKIHKKEFKLRPVVNGRGDFKKEIEGFLKSFIDMLLEGDEGSEKGLKSTEEAILEIEQWKVEEGIIFSFDVKAMFTSMKREFVIESVREMMKKQKRGDSWMVELLEWFLNNSFCRIGEVCYRMEEGLPIGSGLSPALAEIGMRRWVRDVVKVKGKDQLRAFGHYVDDGLGQWRGDIEGLKKFKGEVEVKEWGIELELEVEEKGRIVFLDFELIREKTGFERRWHQKECSAGVYCHSRSGVGSGTKKNMVLNMFRRIERIATFKWKREGQDRFARLLLGNGYKRGMIEKLKKEAQVKGIKKKKKQDDGKGRGWIGIRYCGKVSERIKRRLEKRGFKVYFKMGRKVDNIANGVGFGKKINVIGKKGVVYKIGCKECNGVYIGETKRELGIRIKEHKRNVCKGNEQSAPYVHYREQGHELDYEGAKIVLKEKSTFGRRILEGIVIEEHSDNINIKPGKMIGVWGERIGLKFLGYAEGRKSALRKDITQTASTL